MQLANKRTRTGLKLYTSTGAPCFFIHPIGTQCRSLIFASADSILPRAHVVHMWWVLRRSQNNRRTTYQACFYAHLSHTDSSSQSSNTAGSIAREYHLWDGEDALPILPLTVCCLHAHDWTFWSLICTLDLLHLQVMCIIRTRGRGWDNDVCVQAPWWVPATVSCHPHVFFHSQSLDPCQAHSSLLSMKGPRAYGKE